MKKGILFSSASFLMPALAIASEEAHKGPDFMGLVWRIVVFAVFAFILFKLLKEPLMKMLTKRTEDIEKAIKNAELAKSQAEVELTNYKLKLSEMNRELEIMKERAMKTAESEKIKILEDADKTIQRLKSYAESLIESDLKRAKDELKTEVFLTAIQIAEEKLGSKLDAQKQKELMDKYIKRIGALN